LSNDEHEIPWFRIRFVDGREVEIHAPNAIEIYEKDYKSHLLDFKPSHTEDDSREVSSVQPSSQISKPSGTTDAILKILGTNGEKPN
jgi:hypothetical protein